MIKDLPTDRIHRRDDARQINPANVEALASSIADIGLINPIRVRPNSDGWEVIAGNHRLEAHKNLGLTEISCDVVVDDEDHAETAMIDENVIRQELSPVDRARYLARRKELYLTAHPETERGKGNLKEIRNLEPSERVPHFSEAVAAATGRSHSAVAADVMRGERVIDEVLDMLRNTPLDQGSYLDNLAKLPPNDQFKAAQRDLARERDSQRVKMAETNASNMATKARRKAAQAAARIIARYVPAGERAGLLAFLTAAGKASEVAKEIELIPPHIPDRSDD